MSNKTELQANNVDLQNILNAVNELPEASSDASVTITSITESDVDGGENVITFSDGSTLTVKNGSKGSVGDPGQNGKTAYQYAQDGGFTGTEAEFAAKMATEYLPLTGGAITGAINVSGTQNILDFGTTGYFRGLTSSGNRFDFFALVASSRFVVGGSYPTLELKGKNERPTYNGNEMALKNDTPSKTETLKFTLEDGSTVEMAVYVK